MYWRADETITHWKVLDSFLKGLYRRVRRRKRTWKWFKTYTGLSSADAKKVLEMAAGQLPKIYTDVLDDANGEYRGGDTVYLNFDLASALQFGHKKASRRQMELMIESTLLHEIVHWARKKKSAKTRGVEVHGHKFEAGKRFECRAYGGDISLLDSGLILSKSRLKGGDRYDEYSCKKKTAKFVKRLKVKVHK